MKTFGLIGLQLTHSFSEGYFTRKFNELGLNCLYQNFPIENLSYFQNILRQYPDLQGLNITIPYKKNILSYCDILSDEARSIGAVNCIKIITNGKIKGYNTDWTGFEKSLMNVLKPKQNYKALVLGTGGSSAAVCYALKRMNIPVQLVSRSKNSNNLQYSQLTENVFSNYNVIVNCTPLGMFPNIDACPSIPYNYLTPQHICFDLIYNPYKTLFLSKAEKRGATIKNGLEMLEIQAEESWKIWNNNE